MKQRDPCEHIRLDGNTAMAGGATWRIGHVSHFGALLDLIILPSTTHKKYYPIGFRTFLLFGYFSSHSYLLLQLTILFTSVISEDKTANDFLIIKKIVLRVETQDGFKKLYFNVCIECTILWVFIHEKVPVYTSNEFKLIDIMQSRIKKLTQKKSRIKIP